MNDQEAETRRLGRVVVNAQRVPLTAFHSPFFWRLERRMRETERTNRSHASLSRQNSIAICVWPHIANGIDINWCARQTQSVGETKAKRRTYERNNALIRLSAHMSRKLQRARINKSFGNIFSLHLLLHVFLLLRRMTRHYDFIHTFSQMGHVPPTAYIIIICTAHIWYDHHSNAPAQHQQRTENFIFSLRGDSWNSLTL